MSENDFEVPEKVTWDMLQDATQSVIESLQAMQALCDRLERQYNQRRWLTAIWRSGVN